MSGKGWMNNAIVVAGLLPTQSLIQASVGSHVTKRRIVPPAFRKGMNVFGVRRPKRASHSTTTVLTLSMANVRIGWTLRESRHTTVWTAPPCQTVLPVWRDLAVGGVETITIPKSGSVWVVDFLGHLMDPVTQ